MNEVLHVENLSKSFSGKKILHQIDLTLEEGQNLVVMGKSGTGKSVLIKCIVRLINPDTGTIRVFGEDILTPDWDQVNRIRRKIGFLFQGGALYDSMSVRENLEFPLTRTRLVRDKTKIRGMIREALENVGLTEALNKRPSELSGGMIKRLGLARTLILKPRIILYDEPTTGLDPITAREISELILRVQNKYNASSIIITHDQKCAELTANQIVILQNARFIARGSFKELKHSNQQEVREYFN